MLQLKAHMIALSPRKRHRLGSQILEILHAAELDEEWAPFETILDRLRTKRVKRPLDNYDSECCNYVIVKVALYNAAATAADLLK